MQERYKKGKVLRRRITHIYCSNQMGSISYVHDENPLGFSVSFCFFMPIINARQTLSKESFCFQSKFKKKKGRRGRPKTSPAGLCGKSGEDHVHP